MLAKPRLWAVSILFLLLLWGCANFVKLGQNLNFMDKTISVSGHLTNASSHKSVLAFVVDWDRAENKIHSVDYTEVKGIGVFGFFVKESENLYLMAFADSNGNGEFDDGEPAWISHDENDRIAPITPNPNGSDATGVLKRNFKIPPELVAAAEEFYQGRDRTEVKTGWGIPVGLGEVADVSEERFSSEKAAGGYWEPAAYPMQVGIGVYFTEKYDPSRIPVVFVHGAAGSPNDFNTFFDDFDRKRFQLWFYHYPSGRALAEVGGALDRGIRLLRSHYGFDKIHVVAHSMGGLVSRYAILENERASRPCIGRFASISSPFGGQEFAATGVKRAPSVIPSWRDIEPGSDFIDGIFSKKLRGDVDHLLIYGNKSSRGWGLPAENDGTVSVVSMTYEPAVKDAVEVESHVEDHMSILSNPEVIREVEVFLRAGN